MSYLVHCCPKNIVREEIVQNSRLADKAGQRSEHTCRRGRWQADRRIHKLTLVQGLLLKCKNLCIWQVNILNVNIVAFYNKIFSKFLLQYKDCFSLFVNIVHCADMWIKSLNMIISLPVCVTLTVAWAPGWRRLNVWCWLMGQERRLVTNYVKWSCYFTAGTSAQFIQVVFPTIILTPTPFITQCEEKYNDIFMITGVFLLKRYATMRVYRKYKQTKYQNI